jgi:hypothetical protein
LRRDFQLQSTRLAKANAEASRSQAEVRRLQAEVSRLQVELQQQQLDAASALCMVSSNAQSTLTSSSATAAARAAGVMAAVAAAPSHSKSGWTRHVLSPKHDARQATLSAQDMQNLQHHLQQPCHGAQLLERGLSEGPLKAAPAAAMAADVGLRSSHVLPVQAGRLQEADAGKAASCAADWPLDNPAAKADVDQRCHKLEHQQLLHGALQCSATDRYSMLVAEADAALERLAACKKAPTAASTHAAVAAAAATAAKIPIIWSSGPDPAIDGSAAVDAQASTNRQQLLFPTADLHAGQRLQVAHALKQPQLKDCFSVGHQGTVLDAVKAELTAMDDDLAKAEASIAAATKRLALHTLA